MRSTVRRPIRQPLEGEEVSENNDIGKTTAGTFAEAIRDMAREARKAEQEAAAREQDAAARGIYPATEEEWTETVAGLQARIEQLEADLDIVHAGLRESAAEHDYKESKRIARDALLEYAVTQLKRAGLLDGVKTICIEIEDCDGNCDGCDGSGC
jgi:hypothetical protein